MEKNLNVAGYVGINDANLAAVDGERENSAECNNNMSLQDKLMMNNMNNSLLTDESDMLAMKSAKSNYSSPIKYIKGKFQPGSIKGSVFTLTMAIVGAGSLSLPYAFRNVGVIFGIILLIAAYICTFISLHMVVEASRFILPRPSYQELSKAAYGKWLVTVSSSALMMNLFGGIVSYLVAAGTIVDLVYIVVFNKNRSDINRNVYTFTVIGVSALLVLPLALQRQLSTLRFTALFGLFCVLYLSIALIVSYFRLCDEFYHTCFWKHHHSDAFHLKFDQMFNFKIQGFLKAWPLIIFAYTCHPNVLPIYAELQRRTPTRMHKVFRRALTIALILYLMISVSGYLVFLDQTCGNILVNNFNLHPEVIIAAIAIGISLLLSAPLLTFAFREEFTLLFFGKPAVDTLPHFLITFGCVGCAALIAILVTDISVVFGFIGSTSTPTIAFILPTIFYLKLAKTNSAGETWLRRKKCMLFLLSLILTTISLSSLAYNILTYIYPKYDINNSCTSAQQV